MPSMIGTEIAPPRPAGASHTTNTLFVKKISGEIEMSKPPPMIAGVLASAAIASGATSASWLVSPKPPDSVVMFAISSPTARISPKREAVVAHHPAGVEAPPRRGAARSAGSVSDCAIAHLARPRRRTPRRASRARARRGRARGTARARGTRARGPSARRARRPRSRASRRRGRGSASAPSRRVEVVLGADVDAAGRVVEQQDLRPRGEPAGDHDLLLVAAADSVVIASSGSPSTIPRRLT